LFQGWRRVPEGVKTEVLLSYLVGLFPDSFGEFKDLWVIWLGWWKGIMFWVD
jgi:hypothetical protein